MAFGLQPLLHLVKDFQNTVIFPCDGSGKFNPSSLTPGCSYEVEETPVPQMSQTAASGALSPFGSQPASRDVGSLSPFGSYPTPTPLTRFHQDNHPPPHRLFSQSQQKVGKKTILLANLSLRDSSKPCLSKANKISYSVVTDY